MPYMRTTFKALEIWKTTPLNYCRQLIEEGLDPSTRLEIYRMHDEPDLVISSIGYGAKLTVRDDNTGPPRFAPYRPYSTNRCLKVWAQLADALFY